MNSPMMNHPVAQMVNLMRSGGNPLELMQRMAGGNPQMGQFLQMIGGKNPGQLKQMAMNAARERGTNVQQIAQQLGIPLPENKI